MSSISTVIVLCSICNGFGYVKREMLTDYHKGEYHHWNETCDNCKGKGRVRQITRIEVEPMLEDVKIDDSRKGKRF